MYRKCDQYTVEDELSNFPHMQTLWKLNGYLLNFKGYSFLLFVA